MNSSKYLVYEKTSDTNREYVQQINRSSTYTSKDIGNAIEYDNPEVAKLTAEYLNKRNREKDYKVVAILTEVKEID